MRLQLFILLTKLQTQSINIMSIILSLLLPIYDIILLVGFAVFLDTITGVWSAIKTKQKITSRALSSIVSKTLLYEATLILFYLMDVTILNSIVKSIFSVDLLTTKILALTLLSVEIVSINENYKKVMKIDLWSALKNLFSRAKEITSDVKNIKK
ncbi:MAG: hypothetical protein Unbinned221contig1000_34 [Prokaryotic dsDNA virus sp.]|nr:MAG: hypothetical protein Unbinned221contig1000_34 [Prokaryotic dsDNA virus sp.]